MHAKIARKPLRWCPCGLKWKSECYFMSHINYLPLLCSALHHTSMPTTLRLGALRLAVFIRRWCYPFKVNFSLLRARHKFYCENWIIKISIIYHNIGNWLFYLEQEGHPFPFPIKSNLFLLDKTIIRRKNKCEMRN